MNGQPLVSLCMPTRNRAADLVNALPMILGQTYPHLEILISDNASDDETERICRGLAAADRRVRYVRHEHNIGLHGNHNFCFDESRGEFMCFFHDHDGHHVDQVADYVSFMSEQPTVGIVCGDWEIMNEAGEVVGAREYDVAPITAGLDFIDQTMRSGRSAIGLPGMMLRKSALGSARFDNAAPVGFGDFPIWFEIAERSDIGHIRKRLWTWRVQWSSQSARKILSLTEDFRINLTAYCDAHLRRWPERQALAAKWRRSIDNYVFWALMAEIGLHFRSRSRGEADDRSLFEIFDYRLTPQEFEETLARIVASRRGVVQHAACAALKLLVGLKMTWPLELGARHVESLRAVLGLKER